MSELYIIDPAALKSFLRRRIGQPPTVELACACLDMSSSGRKGKITALFMSDFDGCCLAVYSTPQRLQPRVILNV